MSVIALLTDFREKDGYVGVMKGVIVGIAPDAKVIDLSHDVKPQNVVEAAYLLGRSFPYFPKGTIFCCVIDPGVGTSRHGMAAKLGDYYFIGPDNGLFTILYREINKKDAEIAFHALSEPKYQLDQISRTFHGRDIFSPAAAHLAAGVKVSDFGEAIEMPMLLDLPEPDEIEEEMVGEIIHVDAFGNLASNVRLPKFETSPTGYVSVGRMKQIPIVRTFGEAEIGQVVAVVDSFGYVAISIVNGNASLELGLEEGDQIKVRLFPE